MSAVHSCGLVDENITFSGINRTFVRINQAELQDYFGTSQPPEPGPSKATTTP